MRYKYGKGRRNKKQKRKVIKKPKPWRPQTY